MKWIYAELRNANDHSIASYRINPNFIMAVNLNKQQLILTDFQHPLNYNEEDEERILNLIGRDE